MKKISFNDKCDLTNCVLDGKKTQLRKGTNYCCTDELKHLPKPIEGGGGLVVSCERLESFDKLLCKGLEKYI